MLCHALYDEVAYEEKLKAIFYYLDDDGDNSCNLDDFFGSLDII